MFRNYLELYQKYCEYLKTESAQLNFSDMERGFSSTDALIAQLYETNMSLVYNVRFSETEGKLMLFEPSIENGKKYEDLKLHTLGEYSKKEFAFIDTYKNMKYCVFFDKCAYILTDYGIIKMSSEYEQVNHIAKISTVTVWLDDETHKQEVENFINESAITIPILNKTKKITVCTQGTYGIRDTEVEINHFDCDIKNNYNDDLPYDKINELLKSEKEELILLHGEPGTGKTSIIKKIINDNKDVDFIYFDFNLLTSFSDGKIFDFLMEHKKNVLIIEDCEKLFTDRNNGNQYLNSMLNLTDGIIGEAFAIKFICTFNCQINKIDKAIMRKGRLSLIYEFKKLSLEKTKKLCPTATEPKTLAEIYNTDDNGNKTRENKIGF